MLLVDGPFGDVHVVVENGDLYVRHLVSLVSGRPNLEWCREWINERQGRAPGEVLR